MPKKQEKQKNALSKIVVDFFEEFPDGIDVSFVFTNNIGEEFSSSEFISGTKTKKLLQKYEDAIHKLVCKLGHEI